MHPNPNHQTLSNALNNRTILDVCTALSLIPSEYRKVFVLRFGNHYSEEETAKQLNIQVNMVKDMENYALEVFVNGINKLPFRSHQTKQFQK